MSKEKWKNEQLKGLLVQPMRCFNISISEEPFGSSASCRSLLGL